MKLCDLVSKRGFSSYHVAKQLIRCGTSIGANAEEAQEGQTKADFIAKMSIARKEAREAVFWLRVSIHCGVVNASEVAWELDEAKQLLAMTRAAVRTARSSPTRGTITLLLSLLFALLFALFFALFFALCSQLLALS